MGKNFELLDKIVAYIEKHPEDWDQQSWYCDTAFCVAGHAVYMGFEIPRTPSNMDELEKAVEKINKTLDLSANIKNKELLDDYIVEKQGYKLIRIGEKLTGVAIDELAKNILGLNQYEASALFLSQNSLKNIKNLILQWKYKEGIPEVFIKGTKFELMAPIFDLPEKEQKYFESSSLLTLSHVEVVDNRVEKIHFEEISHAFSLTDLIVHNIMAI